MKALVRRYAFAQSHATPSRTCVRNGAGSRSRVSWNGVRIDVSVRIEPAYESASPRNGSERPSPKSAPPRLGPARVTAA